MEIYGRDQRKVVGDILEFMLERRARTRRYYSWLKDGNALAILALYNKIMSKEEEQ